MRILQIANNFKIPPIPFVKGGERGTALLMTLLILSGILVVTLGAASLVAQGILMGRTQARSTKAFFAAETGGENVLWEVRKNGYVLPEQNQEDVFNGALSNGAVYSVDYATSSPYVYFTSDGSYRQTRRSVEIGFVGGVGGGAPCVPDCASKLCGDNDGCGGTCPADCSAVPGCRDLAPSNSGIVSGSCCSGNCYQCDSGYQWDGADCVLSVSGCVFGSIIFPCALQ
ncbi:pilus assembly PilX N-terminal domain-containing protein [Candidatus Falkowbacteria bacterium]|nr:pilus assembly PilX N-terminal domain-containing protein [Candidatus Falkowbacteria bacterium]